MVHEDMKQILILLAFLTLTINAFATEQEADLLIAGNDTIYLKSFPLDSLQLGKRPFGYTRQTAPSTDCWRGYKAIWRIVDDRLYLEKIIRCYSDNQQGEENIKSLFEHNIIDFQEKDGMILANWVTMDLYIMDFRIARHYPDKLFVYDGYYVREKNKEKNLSLRIVNGTVEINRLKKNTPQYCIYLVKLYLIVFDIYKSLLRADSQML